MLFQTKIHISKLLLLVYLGLCTATPTDFSKLKIDENGIKVLSASCGINYYPKSYIYNSVSIGARQIRALLDYRPAMEYVISYIPPDDEILPIEGPYFRQVIITSLSAYPSHENDYVIFTLQGQLVKLVKETLIDDQLVYQDCRLEPAKD